MSSKEPKPPLQRRVPLRVLLLSVNLIILMTPVLALWTTQIYENILLRRAEESLLQQGALIASQWVHITSALDPDLFPNTPTPTTQPAKSLNLNRTRVHPPLSVPITHPSPADTELTNAAIPLKHSLSLLPERSSSAITLLSPHGHILATSASFPATDQPSYHHLDLFQEARLNHLVLQLHNGSKLCMTRTPADRNEDLCLVILQPIVHEGHLRGALLLSTSPLSVWSALRKDTITLWLLVAVLLGALLLQTWAASFAIVQPIRLLVAQAKQLTSGDQTSLTLLESPVTREVQELSEALVIMAHTLETRSEYIKTFASNVSHEFKTPLASIRGSVELLEDHIESMDAEERAHFLSMIDRHAERLQHLVHRLLELARADVLQPTEGTITHLPNTAQRCVDRFRDQHPNIPIHTHIPNTPHAVAISPETFDSILSNLFENARQHGPHDVTITLHVDLTPTHALYTVSNTGSTISPANAARIFDPFFTTARDSGGTGLGLSVVRSLLHAHGGSIDLLQTSPTHAEASTTFRVTYVRVSSQPMAPDA